MSVSVRAGRTWAWTRREATVRPGLGVPWAARARRRWALDRSFPGEASRSTPRPRLQESSPTSVFSLPSYVGAILAMLLFGLVPVALYPALHRLWARVARAGDGALENSVSARIGVIHAVVLGMMFSNVTVEYTGMIGALESEASALIRLYNEMERRDVEYFGPAMEELNGYLRFVVVEQWPALREGRLSLIHI